MTTEITEIINGFKQFSENPYLDSINFLREYIEVEQSDEAFFELGKALFHNGDYDESIEWLKKSEDCRSDAYIGLDYYKKEDFPSAIRHLNEFQKQNTNETILSYLMLSHEKNNDWINAVECGEKLLEINPNNSSIKIRLIDYHFNLREYEISLSYLNELDGEKFRYKKGEILFKIRKYEEAIEELKNLKCTKAYRLISKSYLRLDKPSKAIRYLAKVYEKDLNIETLFEISEIGIKNGYYQHSIDTLEKIRAMEAKNETALEKIAKCYIELQEFETAKMYCEELLKINENNFNACLLLSEIYQYFDKYDKALEFVENGLKINPKSAELWIQKAGCHYPFDFEEFLKSFEHAVKLEPNNTENYTSLIRFCALENRMEDAHRHYERLLFYNPAFEESFEEIAPKNFLNILSSALNQI